MTFLAGSFFPFLIFADDDDDDPFPVLIAALRGGVLVSSLRLEVSVSVVVVAGVDVPRLRFGGVPFMKNGASSISNGLGEPREDRGELSSSLLSSCLTARSPRVSPAANPLMAAANPLVFRRPTTSAFLPIVAVSRARREVFMRDLHGYVQKGGLRLNSKEMHGRSIDYPFFPPGFQPYTPLARGTVKLAALRSQLR